MEKYQLIVIGSGPGGYIAAVEAAKLGKKVAVIEKNEIGGTCLNKGCMPTKTLMHTTDILSEMRHASNHGINTGEITVDFLKMYERKDEVVATLRRGVEGLLKSNKVEVISGSATILTANTIRVGEETYQTDNIIIATGAKPYIPPIIGINRPNVVTSDELLTANDQPYSKLLIIGGGIIGIEFATIYNALGCEVTIIEAQNRILPTMDREISQSLSMILKKRGIKIYTDAVVNEVEGEDILTCHFVAKGKEETVSANGILVAVGRRANIENLIDTNFELATDMGMIMVDEKFETSVKGVFAIGDVIKGGIQLAHVASAQAINVAASICGQEATIDLSLVPSCIYTNPEIAVVGISAELAKQDNIPIKTAKYVMSSNGKSIITSAERGFIKILFHEETEVILGAQLMCSRATDMIGELTVAIANKLTIKELSTVIRPHPTYCEGITQVAINANAKSSLK